MAPVVGFDPNQSGQQPVDGATTIRVGVWGDSDSGVGVFGSSGALPPGNRIDISQLAGVEGHGARGGGSARHGVCGRSIAGNGVQGVSFSEPDPAHPGKFRSAFGVLGVTDGRADPTDESDPRDPGVGVYGAAQAHGIGVKGQAGTQPGVVGSSRFGLGVQAVGGRVGVFGETFDGKLSDVGVLGTSGAGAGVHGVARTTGRGLSGTAVFGAGVQGLCFSGAAVRGTTMATFGGWAGDFVGHVRVTGTLTKGGGGFEIDHPLDPENMYLAHSFVESPEMLNVYNGTVITDESGNGEVRLPDYFEALNSDYRYQLTVIGEFAQAIVAREVEDNRFSIRTDRPQIKVCWQVTGVRRDRWAQANRITVESTKNDLDRGRYLHPEMWGQAAEGIRSWADDARSQAIEMLPESLRERWEALTTSDIVDHDALQRLIEEASRFPDWPERPSRARLEDDWRVTQEMMRGLGIGDEAG